MSGVLFTHSCMSEHTQQGSTVNTHVKCPQPLPCMNERIPASPLGLTVLFPVQRAAGSEGGRSGGQVVHVNHDRGLY